MKLPMLISSPPPWAQGTGEERGEIIYMDSDGHGIDFFTGERFWEKSRIVHLSDGIWRVTLEVRF